jgi:multidrug resistance protein
VLMNEHDRVRMPTGSPLHTEPPVARESNGRAFAQDVESLSAETTMAISYSVFTRREKRFIIFMVAWAGLFAPLSAAIYYPALPTLARDMHVSNALINLTVTSFMLFQALAPTIFGDLADKRGRRPIYMSASAIYLAANIGLAKQNSFVALSLLRCLQSAGSSGIAVLGNSIVADIATSGDRGTYMGIAYAGALLGPAVGPVIGGVISQFLGWRAIFWFLTVLCGVFTVLFLICFPETGRNIVGNGSVPPTGWSMSLLNYLQVRKFKKDTQLCPAASRGEQLSAKANPAGRQFRWPNPLKTVYILMEKDAVIILLYNGFIYTSFYCVTASAPAVLKRIYGFNDLQIGLCYMYTHSSISWVYALSV